MRKALLFLAAPTLALVLAVAAIAFVPGMLNRLSPGAGPTAMSIPAPAWKVGDSWTYNLSFGSTMEREFLPQEVTGSMPAGETWVFGTLTETVAGAVSTDDGAAWNVTESATLTFGVPNTIMTVQPTLPSLGLREVTVTGFAWIRQSDLAVIESVRTTRVHVTWIFDGTVGTTYGILPNGTYSVYHNSTTEVAFKPALAVFQFPLEQNTTWNVSSNATIRYWSSFTLQGPNLTFGSTHNATFTIPVEFRMRTGTFENISTPAGTFRALAVSALHGDEPWRIPDRDVSATMNLTAETDAWLPRGVATAWFSAQVGNVVQANVGLGGLEGPRVEMDLVSYTYS